MPYGKKQELPDAVKALPEQGQEIWMAAFNSASEQYQGDEEKCFATAWAAVQNKFEKNDAGEWAPKKEGSSHADSTLPWIQVFRTGRHTDSAGVEKEWKEEDLEKIVSSYKPSDHEAPVVIGHPKDNAPAWGWVEGLKRDGQFLYAKFKDLVPEFVEMVKKGLFKKRSIAIYPDLTLRHIGFLGALPPAVKGLADIKFEENAVTIEYGDEIKKKGGTKMGLRDILKSIFTKAIDDIPEDQLQVVSPRTFTEAEVKERERLAMEKAGKDFSEKEKGIKDREAAVAAQEKEAKKKSLSDFCEGLLKAGKLTPAMSKQGMGMVSFLEAAAGIPAEVEFEEGGQKKKQTALEFAKSFLEGLPKIVEYREIAGRDKVVAGDGQAGAKFEVIIRQKMAANKVLSYNTAFTEAQAENPDLAKEYMQEIGHN
jgi:cation transport regulator ChaB